MIVFVGERTRRVEDEREEAPARSAAKAKKVRNWVQQHRIGHFIGPEII